MGKALWTVTRQESQIKTLPSETGLGITVAYIVETKTQQRLPYS